MWFFLASFLILGAGIKYIDDAFDEKRFSKKIAVVVAPLLGLLWAYTMLIDVFAATILLAIIIGVFCKGKIDNIAHFAGLAVILGVVVVAGVELLIPTLLFLAAAGFIDEIGNDLVDKHRKRLQQRKYMSVLVMYFFDHRWTMKLALLSLVIVQLVPYYFLFALLLFDSAYLGVRWYSGAKQDLPFLGMRLRLANWKDAVMSRKDTQKTRA